MALGGPIALGLARALSTLDGLRLPLDPEDAAVEGRGRPEPCGPEQRRHDVVAFRGAATRPGSRLDPGATRPAPLSVLTEGGEAA